MSMFDLEKFDSINANLISEMHFTENEIARMRSEIERMMTMCEILSSHLSGLGKKIIESPPIKLRDTIDSILDDFYENGFAGEKVYSSVVLIRALFFNDELAEFQDLACINIDKANTTDCVGLEFTFESLTIKNKIFSIFVPASSAAFNFYSTDFYNRQTSTVENNSDAFFKITVKPAIDVSMRISIIVGGADNKDKIMIPKLQTLSYSEMAKTINDIVLKNDYWNASSLKKELEAYVKKITR
jgi:hypothetical protein